MAPGAEPARIEPGLCRRGCHDPPAALAVTIGIGAAISAAVGAVAQTPTPAPTCKGQAAEKKLAGAALASFTSKCRKDAAAACDLSAKEKKLAGAAKTSFTKKCVSDAEGT